MGDISKSRIFPSKKNPHFNGFPTRLAWLWPPEKLKLHFKSRQLPIQIDIDAYINKTSQKLSSLYNIPYAPCMEYEYQHLPHKWPSHVGKHTSTMVRIWDTKNGAFHGDIPIAGWFFLMEHPTGWGPPVMWTLVYKPWINPHWLARYIYHKPWFFQPLTLW